MAIIGVYPIFRHTHIVAAVNRIRSKGERCCNIGCCTQWGRWCRSVGMVVRYFWVVGWLPVTYPFEGHRIIGSMRDKFISSYSATGRWQFISSLPILQDQERPGVRRFLPDGDTAQDASQDWRRATFPTNLHVPAIQDDSSIRVCRDTDGNNHWRSRGPRKTKCCEAIRSQWGHQGMAVLPVINKVLYLMTHED